MAFTGIYTHYIEVIFVIYAAVFVKLAGTQTPGIFCNNEQPLGMESGAILDSQITQSSVLSSQYSGSNARLNKRGAWYAQTSDKKPWIRIDLRRRRTVTRIIMQGYGSFIGMFYLEYGDAVNRWNIYTENGATKIFQGNIDGKSSRNITISPPIVGQFIKLHATKWHQYCTLRMELYGCNYTSPTLPPSITTTASALCRQLIIPQGGSITCLKGSSIGSICNFTCHSDYTLQGNYQLKCRSDGTWDLREPACYKLPGKPDQIQVTAALAKTISITWRKPTDGSSLVTSYSVRFRSSQATPVQKVVSRPSAVLAVKPYTVYSIDVRAVSSYGSGPWSVAVTIRSDEAVPSMTPPNFQVTSTKSLELTVAWQAIPPEGQNGIILGYNVYYYRSGSPSDVITKALGPTTYRCTLSNLKYASYYVSVAGYTRIGNGPITSYIKKTPMEGAPTPPRNLQAFVQGPTAVHLTWVTPEKLNGILRKYVVKYGTQLDQMVNAMQVPGHTNNSLVASLQEFTTYYFNVYAETSVTGQPSNVVSATTTDDAPDATPTITSVVARDAYTIYVAWAKIPAINRNGIILGYTVFYKISGQGSPHNVTYRDETKLSTEITGLRPYTTYCVKMAAFTRVGLTKRWDEKACKWITTLETGPSAPVDIKGYAQSSIEIYIEWKIPTTPNGVITKYIVYYGPQRGNLQSKVLVTSKTLSTVITGLGKFTTYYFQVRGKTTKPGNASAVVAVKTMEDLPSAPVAFTGSPASPDSTLLVWSRPTEINGILRSYLITTYEKKTEKQVGKVINQTAYPLDNPKTPITALVIGLKPFREYVHSIRAYTIGPGPEANCTARTLEGEPSAPQNLQVRLLEMAIYIEWMKPKEENGRLVQYTVYCMGTRSYQPLFTDTRITSVTPDTLTYKVSRLEPGTLYTIYVAGNTAVGEGDKSERSTITTPSKPPPAPEQPTFNRESVTSSSVVVFLNASPFSNGQVIAHQLIVKKLQKVAKRAAYSLPSYITDYKTAKKNGSPYYVTAEFRGSTVPTKFVVGDSKVYQGYPNVPLEPKTEYEIYIRGVTTDNDGRWVYGAAARVSLPATAPARKGPDTASSDKNVGLIAGIVGALIAIVVFLIVVALYRRSKRPLKPNLDCENQKSKSKRRFRDLELRRLAGKKRSLSNPGDLTNDPEHPPITVNHFAKHVYKLHKSDDRGFMIEYNKLDSGREFPCDVAYSVDNKAKNRYGNIVAYDHSRVVLSTTDNVPSSDYINASHIDGYNKPNAYIATQGPIPPTFNDFWRMVWEQQSSSIVMLTNLQERHKLKCHKYWPDETEEYGDIVVKLLRSEHYADYSIRTFNVKRDAEKEEREVKQFHFIVWPDHGVPEYPTAILAFRRRVRAYNPPDAGSVIVHCSAGVGRSGTFIVIDTMLDRVNAENSLDIFNYVAYLRSRRTAMVQTEEQYTFCHDAILEAIQCGNTQILAHDLRIALSRMDNADKDLKMTKYEAEFKTLNKVSPVLPKACYIVASYPESKEKNRHPDVLASDFSRVVLTAIDDNEITTYINAVHISGYKQQHAFIVTQYPLTATVTDHWRMLCEQDSSCLVVFQPSEEGDFPQFWPEVGTETYDDMITVQCSDEKSSSVDNLRSSYNQSEISELRFKVKDLRTPEKVLKVKMFMVSGWSNEDEPPPTSAIITLTAKVEKWQQQSGNGPITVVCSDGIGRSGAFCALYSVLERVKIEQVVDVFQAIKAMRIPRPGLVKTTAEYKFIHYAVQEYLAAFDDYANFK